MHNTTNTWHHNELKTKETVKNLLGINIHSRKPTPKSRMRVIPPHNHLRPATTNRQRFNYPQVKQKPEANLLSQKERNFNRTQKVPSSLLQHIKHISLKNMINGFNANTGPTLRHRKHIHNAHGVLIHELPQHQTHHFHGYPSSSCTQIRVFEKIGPIKTKKNGRHRERRKMYRVWAFWEARERRCKPARRNRGWGNLVEGALGLRLHPQTSSEASPSLTWRWWWWKGQGTSNLSFLLFHEKKECFFRCYVVTVNGSEVKTVMMVKYDVARVTFPSRNYEKKSLVL